MTVTGSFETNSETHAHALRERERERERLYVFWCAFYRLINRHSLPCPELLDPSGKQVWQQVLLAGAGRSLCNAQCGAIAIPCQTYNSCGAARVYLPSTLYQVSAAYCNLSTNRRPCLVQVEAISNCLHEPMGRSQCSNIQGLPEGALERTF